MDKQNPASRRDRHQTEATTETAGWNGGKGGTATGDRSGKNGPRTTAPTPTTEKPATTDAPTSRGDLDTALADAPATFNSQKLQETFMDERDDVLAVINELEDQLDRYQDIRATLERELTETTEQLQQANQRTQELEWQSVTLQTRVDALEQVRQEMTLYEEQIAEANSRAGRLSEQVGRTEKENSRLEGELKNANKQLEEFWAVRKERDGLRTDLRTMRAKLDEFERTQRESLEERAQMHSRLQEAQAALDDVREIRHQVEADLRAAADRAVEAQRSNKALEDKLESLRNEKKTLQAQLTHLERENVRLVEQRQFYEGELTSVRNANRSAEAALGSVKKAFAEVRVALTETRSRARRRTMDAWPRIGSAFRPDGAGQEIVDTATIDAGELPTVGMSFGDAPTAAPRSTSVGKNLAEDALADF